MGETRRGRSRKAEEDGPPWLSYPRDLGDRREGLKGLEDDEGIRLRAGGGGDGVRSLLIERARGRSRISLWSSLLSSLRSRWSSCRGDRSRDRDRDRSRGGRRLPHPLSGLLCISRSELGRPDRMGEKPGSRRRASSYSGSLRWIKLKPKFERE